MSVRFNMVAVNTDHAPLESARPLMSVRLGGDSDDCTGIASLQYVERQGLSAPTCEQLRGKVPPPARRRDGSNRDSS